MTKGFYTIKEEVSKDEDEKQGGLKVEERDNVEEGGEKNCHLLHKRSLLGLVPFVKISSIRPSPVTTINRHAK
ncbi:hypothetical protein CHUAL_008124 [Chamberlinius hualienensis]